MDNHRWKRGPGLAGIINCLPDGVLKLQIILQHLSTWSCSQNMHYASISLHGCNPQIISILPYNAWHPFKRISLHHIIASTSGSQQRLGLPWTVRWAVCVWSCEALRPWQWVGVVSPRKLAPRPPQSELVMLPLTRMPLSQSSLSPRPPPLVAR